MIGVVLGMLFGLGVIGGLPKLGLPGLSIPGIDANGGGDVDVDGGADHKDNSGVVVDNST